MSSIVIWKRSEKNRARQHAWVETNVIINPSILKSLQQNIYLNWLPRTNMMYVEIWLIVQCKGSFLLLINFNFRFRRLIHEENAVMRRFSIIIGIN